jgi:signal transduction histidine kinase
MKPTAELEQPPFGLAAQTGSLGSGELEGDKFLRSIVDTCAADLAILDELGAVLYVSRSWGLIAEPDERAESQLHRRYQGIFSQPGGGASAFAEDIQRIIEGRVREFHKQYSVAGDDGPLWFLMHAARLDLPGSNRYRVLVTREDVTRQREAEEAFRNLGGRLIKAQEEERSRVARELHDDLSQRLAIMSIELEQLEQEMPGPFPGLAGRVTRLRTKAQEMASEIHRISYQLHPAKLDHLGLAAAIRSLCDELSEHQEITIGFSQQGFPALLPKEITLCVFRIAQESLHNVCKHSGARNAEVRLRRTSRGVQLRVSDTGCGFDVQSLATRTGLGFISMRERLRLVGGKISIRSQPSGGTQINVLVPG